MQKAVTGQAISTKVGDNAANAFVISSVRIVPVQPADGLIGFASCVINDRLLLSSIAVHRKLDGSGYRLTYPTKRGGNRDHAVFHPLEPGLSKALEEAIFAECEHVFGPDSAAFIPTARR